jgi:hypothetical protein
MTDRGLQDGSDALAQGSDLREAQRRRPPRRADSGAEEGLVGIDVPNPRDLPLIQEE